jgi:hypothetical protein
LSASTWLTVAGYIAEAIGLALLVLSVVRGWQQARRFSRRGQVLYAEAVSMSASTGWAVASGGREPSIEERVQALEKQSQSLNKTVNALPKQRRTDWRDDITAAERRLGLQLQDFKAAAQPLLVGMSHVDAALQIASAAFVFVGLGLQLAGSPSQ